MKICNSCFVTKSLEEFAKASTCKDGHRNYCKACHHIRKETWRREHMDQVKAKADQWKLDNKGALLKIQRKWRQANPEYGALKRKEWRLQNPERARAQVNYRRRTLRNAQPLWAATEAIKAVYAEAQRLSVVTGIPHHVDHVIPLLGKEVSGLHIETNLRVIPAFENLSKSNKYEVGYYEG